MLWFLVVFSYSARRSWTGCLALVFFSGLFLFHFLIPGRAHTQALSHTFARALALPLSHRFLGPACPHGFCRSYSRLIPPPCLVVRLSLPGGVADPRGLGFCSLWDSLGFQVLLALDWVWLGCAWCFCVWLCCAFWLGGPGCFVWPLRFSLGLANDWCW